MSGEDESRAENDRLRVEAAGLRAQLAAQSAAVEAADRLSIVLLHPGHDWSGHAAALAEALAACPGTRAARWAEARANQSGGG